MKKFFVAFFFLILILFGVGLGIVLGMDKKLFTEKSEEVSSDPIVVSIQDIEREIISSTTEVSVISDSEIEIKSAPQSVLQFVGNKKSGEYYYILIVNQVPEGKSTRKVVFQGKGSTAQSEHELKFNHIRSGSTTIYSWSEAKYIIDPLSPLAIVNNSNKLAEDFVPSNLIDLNKDFGIYTFNDAMLTKDAGANLKRMWEDCGSQTGDYVTVASGYRSWSNQAKLYSSNVLNYGQTDADTFSARAGHSEHQLGTVVDFTNKEMDYKLSEEFENTKSGIWLKENAHKYGFIMSYPRELKEKSGFFEPWQFRYIGIQKANEFVESGEDFYTFATKNQD